MDGSVYMGCIFIPATMLRISIKKHLSNKVAVKYSWIYVAMYECSTQ